MPVLAVAFTGLFVAAAISSGVPWWGAILLWLAPDAGLLAGAAGGKAPQQLHPRAVPLYNALHRFHGPAVLGAAAAAGIIPAVLPLAWASHIAIDRALGYGLRTREGFQRA